MRIKQNDWLTLSVNYGTCLLVKHFINYFKTS